MELFRGAAWEQEECVPKESLPARDEFNAEILRIYRSRFRKPKNKNYPANLVRTDALVSLAEWH